MHRFCAQILLKFVNYQLNFILIRSKVLKLMRMNLIMRQSYTMRAVKAKMIQKTQEKRND